MGTHKHFMTGYINTIILKGNYLNAKYLKLKCDLFNFMECSLKNNLQYVKCISTLDPSRSIPCSFLKACLWLRTHWTAHISQIKLQ